MPTLQGVLGIELDLLMVQEREGMVLAEEIYKLAGAPVNKLQVAQVIEVIQVESRRRGVRYPRILLRRKIEMQRGMYAPQDQNRGPEWQKRRCRTCGRSFVGDDAFRDHLSKHECQPQPKKVDAEHTAMRRAHG